MRALDADEECETRNTDENITQHAAQQHLYTPQAGNTATVHHMRTQNSGFEKSLRTSRTTKVA
jgi:hypothetical protein